MQHPGIIEGIMQAWLARKDDLGVLTSENRLAELLWQHYTYVVLCVVSKKSVLPPLFPPPFAP